MARATFEELVETFEFLDDWEDRYRHVIEIGRALPPFDDALKTPGTKVDGCASQVWLYPSVEGKGPEAIVTFEGDSDAMIVKGLIAVLRRLYSGLSAAEILTVNASFEMGRLGLNDHLSSQRSNGLRAMIARLRDIATNA
ncbi:MAG: SufE family protein [Pseudomonadota bacterium]